MRHKIDLKGASALITVVGIVMHVVEIRALTQQRLDKGLPLKETVIDAGAVCPANSLNPRIALLR
jgi:hypothetical protein